MCKYGFCLCGQPDFCQGHEKAVCGSDGRLYPSHCELHRTACVLGVHIRIDKEKHCMVTGRFKDVCKYTDFSLELVKKEY